VKYKILYADDITPKSALKMLEMQVDYWLKQGYVPQGGVSVIGYPSSLGDNYIAMQAMINKN